MNLFNSSLIIPYRFYIHYILKKNETSVAKALWDMRTVVEICLECRVRVRVRLWPPDAKN